MPTFCRHNRFLERCPICSRTLAGAETSELGGQHARRTPRANSSGARATAPARRRAHGENVRVVRHERAIADGYSSGLVPGVHASADAQRLAEEIAFSAGRLQLLREQPPGVYGEVRALGDSEAARAFFLIAYISPGEGEDAFAAIRAALADPVRELAGLSSDQLGPRSSHELTRGARTYEAFERLVEQAGGARAAFVGDPSWTPARRFERLFERLALPGLSRVARYELLVLLAVLGGYELEADSLHLGVARGAATNDPTMLAAKRIFAIGDAIILERRAEALAQAIGLELAALELALWNFFSPQRATLGFPAHTRDEGALGRARAALGV